MHYYIITGGPINSEARNVIGEGCVICADGGTDFAMEHSIIPDRVVGDLDSISEMGIVYIEENNIPVDQFPVEKDWTDTEIAINSIPEGSEITIVCPLDGGGRLDHVIGNLQLAAGFAPRHKRIILTDGVTSVYLMSGNDCLSVDITSRGDLAVSLVPLSFDSCVKGVKTTGLYYRLNGEELKAGKTFSFCNEPDKGVSEFSVSIDEGLLAVIVTRRV